MSRSLLDFARLMESFDRHGVGFVSVTQQFNTATSMGRLVLNVLLSFAQFEREIISERTRDKIAATSRERKLDGAAEARLIALACSPPPLGRAVWTMQLLADKLIELKVVDTVCDETVRRTLKKTA